MIINRALDVLQAMFNSVSDLIIGGGKMKRIMNLLSFNRQLPAPLDSEAYHSGSTVSTVNFYLGGYYR